MAEALRKPSGRCGAANSFWKGGRTVTEHGYVLIRVGIDHHLADVRGYAYEHRVVAEEKIGRRLMPNEIVHHVDGNRQNNDPSNLEVMASIAHHGAEHRTPGRVLRNPGEPNLVVRCACGCGGEFLRFDRTGRPRRFISGHNIQPRPAAASLLDGREHNGFPEARHA